MDVKGPPGFCPPKASPAGSQTAALGFGGLVTYPTGLTATEEFTGPGSFATKTITVS